MDFENWLALQRLSIATLRVRPGDYVARFLARTGSCTASLKITEHATGTLVRVTNHGVVRVRVHHEGREYDFAPAWATGLGLRVERVSPRGPLPRATAELVSGFARAALKKASQEEFERLSSLAAETAGEDDARFADALVALTAVPAEGTALDRDLRAAIVAVLAGRTDGAELLEVVQDCTCVGCERAFRRGDAGPVWLFGETACCGNCLSPARAA